ncbi:MAG: hypothetical protein AMXMBFR59_32760 [Rhodanobacteraceae bacterium]
MDEPECSCCSVNQEVSDMARYLGGGRIGARDCTGSPPRWVASGRRAGSVTGHRRAAARRKPPQAKNAPHAVTDHPAPGRYNARPDGPAACEASGRRPVTRVTVFRPGPPLRRTFRTVEESRQ